MVGRTLDGAGKEGGNVLGHLGGLLADALVAQNALGTEQVGEGPLQTGGDVLVVHRHNEVVSGRSLHDLLHIGLKLLGAHMDKAGLDALDAPGFKLCKNLLRAEPVPAAGVGQIDAVDIEDDTHVLLIGVVTDGGDIHVGLEGAGGAQIFIDVESLSAGIEDALAVGQEGLLSLSGKILLQQDFIAGVVRVQQGGVQTGVAVDVVLRAVPAGIQQDILDALGLGLVHDGLDGVIIHAGSRAEAGTGLHPFGEMIGLLVGGFIEVEYKRAVGGQLDVGAADHKGTPRRGGRGAAGHGDLRSFGQGPSRSARCVRHILRL